VFVGEGSDHLQLINFWLSRTPEKVVCGGAKILAPPYYSQRAVIFVSLSAFLLNEKALNSLKLFSTGYS